MATTSEESEHVDILDPVIPRYKRLIWIPEEAVSRGISAMDNLLASGMKEEDLPHIFIYPVTIDMDSTNQTGDSSRKNLIAFNDYGILTDEQLEANFEFIKNAPKWRNIFARLGNMNDLSLGKDYPIFVPTDRILIHHFAAKIREELFMRNCGQNAADSKHILPYREYQKVADVSAGTSPAIAGTSSAVAGTSAVKSPAPTDPLIKKRSVKKKTAESPIVVDKPMTLEKRIAEVNIASSPPQNIEHARARSVTLADVTRAIEQ